MLLVTLIKDIAKQKANNEYCSDYGSEKCKTYITYLDMNNSYGYAMSQYLPYANFKWFKV